MKGLIYRIKDFVTGKIKLPVTIDRAVQIDGTNKNLHDLTEKFELGWDKTYNGHKLSFQGNKFNVTTIGNLDMISNIKQGIAYDGNYLAVVTAYIKGNPGSTTIWLYNATNWSRLAIITIPRYFHGNTLMFSKNKPSGSNIPYLIIDEWDEGRSWAVVSISNSYQATITALHQVDSQINATDEFGGGMTDWAIDEDNGRFYSLTYKKSGSTTYQDTDNNGLYVCEFVLPQNYLTANSTITAYDIVQNWKRNCIYVRQNCSIKNGLFYILSGSTANGSALAQLAPPRLFVLDSNMNLYAEIDLTQISKYEPEGMAFVNDGFILVNVTESNIYKLDFDNIKL